MSKQILIDSFYNVVRTALTENGQLVDYYEEIPEKALEKGNIYRAQVKRVEKHMDAAFLQYGGRRDGYLQLRDVGKISRNGEEVSELATGDILLVQVIKDGIGDKGALLTTKISLAGRYLIFLPNQAGGGGVSSRVEDRVQRGEMRRMLHEELQIPVGTSVILRTASNNQIKETLQDDLNSLINTNTTILEDFNKKLDIGLVHRDADLTVRYLREYYSEDVDSIIVNSHDTKEQCLTFLQKNIPNAIAKLHNSGEGPLFFQRQGIEEQVERLRARRVHLKSGASLVFDQTEALVAIDVNSAKAKNGQNQTDVIFEVNKEAAREICRQLRLRDLGGIIVVDFIDMQNSKHRQAIESIMRQEIIKDRAKVRAFDISPLGTMQLSRQRLRGADLMLSQVDCPHCRGLGWKNAPRILALAALRKLEIFLRKGQHLQSLAMRVSLDVGNYLMNEFRDEIPEIEKRHRVRLRIEVSANLVGDFVEMESLGASRSLQEQSGGVVVDVKNQVRHGQSNRQNHQGLPGQLGQPSTIVPLEKNDSNSIEIENEVTEAPVEQQTIQPQTVEHQTEVKVLEREIEKIRAPIRKEMKAERVAKREIPAKKTSKSSSVQLKPSLKGDLPKSQVKPKLSKPLQKNIPLAKSSVKPSSSKNLKQKKALVTKSKKVLNLKKKR